MAKQMHILRVRDYVIPQDVKDVFFETIEHRVIQKQGSEGSEENERRDFKSDSL